ncbi:MAG TPA: hypothetical protein VNM90_27375, partial [Haliangium sp.]|nr:hypothetical protein [Haliangium sp.]
MQRQRVLMWAMGAILVGIAAPAWAQTASPDQPVKNQPDDFEGADEMMESGELSEGNTGQGQGSAGQDSAGQANQSRPWAEGVSPEDQAKAQALFKEGNDRLRESVFPQAVKKYR